LTQHLVGKKNTPRPGRRTRGDQHYVFGTFTLTAVESDKIRDQVGQCLADRDHLIGIV